MKLKSELRIIFIVFFLIIFTSCNGVPSITDIQLNKDSDLYAGEGEVCENSYIKVKCSEGLACQSVASSPHDIKVCYPYSRNVSENIK